MCRFHPIQTRFQSQWAKKIATDRVKGANAHNEGSGKEQCACVYRKYRKYRKYRIYRKCCLLLLEINILSSLNISKAVTFLISAVRL